LPQISHSATKLTPYQIPGAFWPQSLPGPYYLSQGKKGMARKDLERILAEDSGYEGVKEQLVELE
jgi:hypothetical protein